MTTKRYEDAGRWYRVYGFGGSPNVMSDATETYFLVDKQTVDLPLDVGGKVKQSREWLRQQLQNETNHIGDPCQQCDTAHDQVPPGPCVGGDSNRDMECD
jgi:hypothetical protein